MLQTPSPPRLVTLVILSGLAALSLNIFLPSLPGMARHFDAPYAQMQIAVSGYLAVSALAQLLIGPISDRFGRRPVQLAVLAIFVLASAAILVAPTAETFLAARMVQSAIATSFVLTRAMVRDMHPGPEAASMIGYVTMGMSVVPMIGPVIGGALDEAFGWRANFAMLAAFGLATLILAWVDLGETLRGPGLGFREQLRSYPILLKSHRFWGYTLAAAFASGSFFAYLGGAPFVGAQIYHLSAAQVGYFFALPALGYAVGNFISGRYATRLGMDWMILAGTLTATLALAAALGAELTGLASAYTFFPAVGLIGLGNGLALPSANAGMMSVRPELAGTASGLGGTLTIGGGAALSALAGTLLGPGATALPLIVLMLVSAALSVASLLWVRARRRRLGV
ncbi:Bcr/CflA family drug resistance efflux transporter [Rhodobacter xanthinilyticus]|uniref:Bcr/CflA family efflux transporter n=1 Tax=Rhodobacter xanthinilyticus TaxID=1850250 RepID=A0A1D9MAZ5_9RHOB|nr:multidrug effflux MFS transporter [Rhodobacter xanthinilyticus]AOZ68960.1 Bcr/CflA family drug resistance efflux transporter [Rhodobacter xanthinilyticus]